MPTEDMKIMQVYHYDVLDILHSCLTCKMSPCIIRIVQMNVYPS